MSLEKNYFDVRKHLWINQKTDNVAVVMCNRGKVGWILRFEEDGYYYWNGILRCMETGEIRDGDSDFKARNDAIKWMTDRLNVRDVR